MKFAFVQNPLTQIPFFASIYNSFIISHLLEWLKARQIKSGLRVNFDQCVPLINHYFYKQLRFLDIIKVYILDWDMNLDCNYVRNLAKILVTPVSTNIFSKFKQKHFFSEIKKNATYVVCNLKIEL